MDVIYMSLKDIHPYPNNPRINDSAIEKVKNSIKEFGFRNPIIIDKNHVIIAGHTRYEASKRLGMEEVPCIIAFDMTEEQAKAFRIADNSTAEQSVWGWDKLNIELADLNFNMLDFGLELPDVPEVDMSDDEEERERDPEKSATNNILNLGYRQYDGVGKYDIPEIEPVTSLPPIREWISFNYVLSDKDPEGKAVHFFIDDYQFERLWNEPKRYLDKLRRYVCVASSDFSPYGDMPLACQIYNHYRKHWLGAWMQEHGVTVIPTVRCSTDPRSLQWFLEGEPKKSIIIMSSMWSTIVEKEAKEEYNLVKKRLKPSKIFIYGDGGGMGIQPDDNVEYIKNFIQHRFRE